MIKFRSVTGMLYKHMELVTHRESCDLNLMIILQKRAGPNVLIRIYNNFAVQQMNHEQAWRSLARVEQ